MVGTSIAANLIACAIFPLGIVAVTLDTGRERVVRREKGSVHVNPYGDMVRDQEEVAQSLVELQSQLKPEEASQAIDLCNIDYVLGKQNSTNCSDTSKHELIAEETVCKFAAHYSGAYAPEGNESMKLVNDWQYKRPKGCYREKCSVEKSPTEVCYMFNTIGDWPDVNLPDYDGVPICSRPRNQNGTRDSQGNCPAGYSLINDEDTCRAVLNCLGYAAGGVFRIGTHNASETLDYPLGCFLNNDDGLVYFNPPDWLAEGKGQEGHIRGTPLCNVSQVVKWGPHMTILPTTYGGGDDSSGGDAAKPDAAAGAAKPDAAAGAAKK